MFVSCSAVVKLHINTKSNYFHLRLSLLFNILTFSSLTLFPWCITAFHSSPSWSILIPSCPIHSLHFLSLYCFPSSLNSTARGLRSTVSASSIGPDRNPVNNDGLMQVNIGIASTLLRDVSMFETRSFCSQRPWRMPGSP